MGLVREIAKSANVDVRYSGSMELIAAADVPAFLDAVRASRTCTILGLEGFRFVESRLVPDMDAIADFSALAEASDCEATAAEAQRFLSAVEDADLYFDVVIRQTRDS